MAAAYRCCPGVDNQPDNDFLYRALEVNAAALITTLLIIFRLESYIFNKIIFAEVIVTVTE
jgi:hypothetical protein